MRGVQAARQSLRRQSLRLKQPQTKDVLLLPRSKSYPEAGLMLIPGQDIDSNAYRPMLKAIQAEAHIKGLSLYLGCMHLNWGAVPLRHPDDLQNHMHPLVSSMQARGMPARVPMFHAAHSSLSTTFLQDHMQHRNATAGLILLGGCLLRKHCYPTFSYKTPTLTIGAELDGVEKIGRQAEQYQIQHSLDQGKFPMVVLPGQTHMQFASGNLPAHIMEELPPAIHESDAHAAIAEVLVDFICLQLGLPQAGNCLERHQRSTQHLLLPLLMQIALGTPVSPAGMLGPSPQSLMTGMNMGSNQCASSSGKGLY